MVGGEGRDMGYVEAPGWGMLRKLPVLGAGILPAKGQSSASKDGPLPETRASSGHVRHAGRMVYRMARSRGEHLVRRLGGAKRGPCTVCSLAWAWPTLFCGVGHHPRR